MTRLLILFILSFGSLMAQQWDEARTSEEFTAAIKLLEQSRFQEADSAFKLILRNAEILPDDITFYFGKNSYHLDQYRQAINWLSKYIELKGDDGIFSGDANDYIKMSQQEMVRINTAIADSINRQRTQPPCKPGDMVTCPVCRGNKVIVRQGPLGKIYEPCTYGNGNGLMSCEDYLEYINYRPRN